MSTTIKKRNQIRSLNTPLEMKELNDQMDWVYAQLLGGVNVKTLSAALKQILDSKATSQEVIYKAATDPANPTDGQLVYNTTQNVLKQWNATTEAYVVIADYDAMNTQLGAVQAVTTGSTDFLGLLASAKYTENGLLLSGINAILQLLLGPAQITFLDTGEPVIWIGSQNTTLTAVVITRSLKIGTVSTLIPTTNGFSIK